MGEIKVWWSAIDTRYSSYTELKRRKVIAQGWPKIGNFVSLLPLIPNHKNEFVPIIQLLGDVAYGKKDWWVDKDRSESRVPLVFWNLLNIKKNDIVVAIEGTKVVGVSRITKDAIESYNHKPEYEYANTIGYPVNWIDWDVSVFNFTPTSSSRGMLGITRLRNESQDVIAALHKYETK